MLGVQFMVNVVRVIVIVLNVVAPFFSSLSSRFNVKRGRKKKFGKIWVQSCKTFFLELTLLAVIS
jgi:hypothetical protein